MNDIYYPRLIKRIRAALIDSLLIPIAAIALLIIGTSIGNPAIWMKIALVALPVVILEPGMISWMERQAIYGCRRQLKG